MPYLSEKAIQLTKDHIKFLQDFNFELIQENLELQSKLLSVEGDTDENRPTNGE